MQCPRTLKESGMKDKADKFRQKAFSSEGYNAVLALAQKYVQVY